MSGKPVQLIADEEMFIEALAKLFVLRIPLSGTTSFITYLLVNMLQFSCSVGSSRHSVAEGEDGRTEIR